MIRIISKEQYYNVLVSPGKFNDLYVAANNGYWIVLDNRGSIKHKRVFLTLYDAISYIQSSTNQCRYCGCTDLWGCSEGCYWIDGSKTVCSSCIPL